MAENLKYQSNNNCMDNSNITFDDDTLKTYGCLYNWDNAMKACPNGWRLPTKEEFALILEYALNNTVSDNLDFSLIAKSPLWLYYPDEGTNDFGFSALPAGHWDTAEGSIVSGEYACFWSSTEHSGPFFYDTDDPVTKEKNFAYYLGVGFGSGVNYILKTDACSVRCIKN